MLADKVRSTASALFPDPGTPRASIPFVSCRHHPRRRPRRPRLRPRRLLGRSGLGRGGGAGAPGSRRPRAGGDGGGGDAGGGGARPCAPGGGRDRHPARGGHLQRAGRSGVRGQSEPPVLRLPGDADGHHGPPGGRARLRRGLRRHQRLRSRAGPAGAPRRSASAGSTRLCSRTASTRRRPAPSPAPSGSRSGTGRPTPASPRASRTGRWSRSASSAASRPPRRCSPPTASASSACATTRAPPASRSAPTRCRAWPRSGTSSSRACAPSASSGSRSILRATAGAARIWAGHAVNPDQLKQPPRGGRRRRASPREQALRDLAELPYADLGFAKLDLHRELRNGLPEAVYAEGKRTADLQAIVERMIQAHGRVLVTRLRPEAAACCGGPPRGGLPRAGPHPHLRPGRAAAGGDRRARRRHLGPGSRRGGRGLRRLVRARRSSAATTWGSPASTGCWATSPRSARPTWWSRWPAWTAPCPRSSPAWCRRRSWPCPPASATARASAAWPPC